MYLKWTRFGFKYSIGAPVFEIVTVIWNYLNWNLLGKYEHPIHRRIGRCLWEPRRRRSLFRYTWCFQFPEICSRKACYDDHSSRGQSQCNHELGQFSEGPSYLGHREQWCYQYSSEVKVKLRVAVKSGRVKTGRAKWGNRTKDWFSDVSITYNSYTVSCKKTGVYVKTVFFRTLQYLIRIEWSHINETCRGLRRDI